MFIKTKIFVHNQTRKFNRFLDAKGKDMICLAKYYCHRIKISNRRVTQRCSVSSFFYAKICSLLARRRSSQPVQRVYWPENVIDWLGKWRPTCVMRHARGQKLQSFRRKWPFYVDFYSMIIASCLLGFTIIPLSLYQVFAMFTPSLRCFSRATGSLSES